MNGLKFMLNENPISAYDGPAVPSSPQADQDFYENISGFTEENLRATAECSRLYYDAYAEDLLAWFGSRSGLHALELGAGTCCLSLLVSNLPVAAIDCLDISRGKMEGLVATSSRLLPSRPEKLRFHRGDFGAQMPFADASFDLILFDAALHHSRSIWNTLGECRRMLRPGGMLIAQREQYLGALTFAPKLRALLRTPEVRQGVSENAYLRHQYEYFFRANGFDVTFKPVAETTLQKLLRPLNGLIHSKWVILARKVA